MIYGTPISGNHQMLSVVTTSILSNSHQRGSFAEKNGHFRWKGRMTIDEITRKLIAVWIPNRPFFFSAVLRCGGQAWDTQYFGPLCPSERFQKIHVMNTFSKTSLGSMGYINGYLMGYFTKVWPHLVDTVNLRKISHQLADFRRWLWSLFRSTSL